MTVSENKIRITNNEEDIESLDKRVTKLETEFNLMMGKLDIIIKMGRVMVGMIAAGLGLDLGIEGGMI
jgi:cell division protein FtsB